MVRRQAVMVVVVVMLWLLVMRVVVLHHRGRRGLVPEVVSFIMPSLMGKSLGQKRRKGHNCSLISALIH